MPNPPSQVSFTRSYASVFLDAIRGIAAFVVCFGHWRKLLFVEYAQIVAHRTIFSIPYLIAAAGHKTVIVFFVLSGFLISGSVFRSFERNQWSWSTYLTHRLVRLWIVLLPALLLGGLFDFIGLHFRLAPALYAGQTGTNMIRDVAAGLHLSTFLGNLFFLQGIFVDWFGSNGPLWSLAYEFWYYILFPCVLLLLRRNVSIAVRISCAVGFCACATLVGKTILLYFPIWLMGTVLGAIKPARTSNLVRVIAVAVYVVLLIYSSKLTMRPSFSDYIVGILTSLLVWLLLGVRSEAPAKLWVHASRVLARFSYTLYLVHTPFLILVTALIAREHRWQPDARHLTFALGALALTTAYAYAVARFTEFRTDTIRLWIEKRILGKSVPVKLPSSA